MSSEENRDPDATPSQASGQISKPDATLSQASGQISNPDDTQQRPSGPSKESEAPAGAERINLSDSEETEFDLELTEDEAPAETPPVPEPEVTDKTMMELGIFRVPPIEVTLAQERPKHGSRRKMVVSRAAATPPKRKASQATLQESVRRKRLRVSGTPSEATLKNYEDSLARTAKVLGKQKRPASEAGEEPAPKKSEKELQKELRKAAAVARAEEEERKRSQRGGAGGSALPEQREEQSGQAEKQAGQAQKQAGRKEKQAGQGPEPPTLKPSGLVKKGSKAALKLEAAEREWIKSDSLKHRFVSASALARYEEAAVKGIIIEKGFTEELMHDWMLAPYMKEHKWTSFCRHQESKVSKLLTSEFLANMRFRGRNNIVMVRGKKVSVSPARIAQVFKLPPPDNEDFKDAYTFENTGTVQDNAKDLCTYMPVHWQTKDGRDLNYLYANALDIPLNVWQRLLQSAVWPTMNTTVNAFQAEALTRIKRKEKVPLAALLYRNLCKVADDPQPRLCHPHLIQRLCAESDVDISEFPLDSGPEFPIWHLAKVPVGTTNQKTLREASGYPRPKSVKGSKPRIPAGEKDLTLSTAPQHAPGGPVIIDTTAFDAEPVRAEIGNVIEKVVGPRISDLQRWRDETEVWKRGQEDVNRQVKDAMAGIVKQVKEGRDAIRDIDRDRKKERKRQEAKDAEDKAARDMHMKILLQLAARVEAMSEDSSTGQRKKKKPAKEPPQEKRARTPSDSDHATRSGEGSSQFDAGADLSPARGSEGDEAEQVEQEQQTKEAAEEKEDESAQAEKEGDHSEGGTKKVKDTDPTDGAGNTLVQDSSVRKDSSGRTSPPARGSEQDRDDPSLNETQTREESTFDLPSLGVNLSLGDSGDVDSQQPPKM